MNRRRELLLVTLFLLLAAALRLWDLTHLPPGFTDDELATIRISESVRAGDVLVFYATGQGDHRASLMPVSNALVTAFVGDGLLGYRMLPVWGGLLTLALVYTLARRLFGPPVALMALGALAVNWRAVLLSRSVTAESLAPLYTTLTALVLVIAFNLRREIRFRAPVTLPFVGLALLFGVSGYLHYSLLVLGPLGFLFFMHLVITHQPLSRRVWNVFFFVMVLATIVALPYLISAFRQPSASEPYLLVSQRPRTLAEVVEGLLQTVGGVIGRGDPSAAANVPDVPLFGPVTAILLLIGVAESVRRWREPRYFLLLIMLAAGLLTDAWIKREPTVTANLAAFPALFILPGLGVMAVWRALRGRGVPQAWQPVAAGLAVLLAANLISLQDRVFAGWAEKPEVAAAYHADLGLLAAYLDRTPDDPPVSLCTVPLRRLPGEPLSDRQVLGLMMHRDDLPLRFSDCQSGLVFINGGAEMRFVFAGLPDDVAIRRRLTQRPDLSGKLTGSESIPLAVRYDAAGMRAELADWLKDGQPIEVAGLPTGTVIRLDVSERLADANGSLWSAREVFFMPQAGGTVVPAAVPVTFEHNLTFAGYEVGGGRVPGDDANPIVLITYWRVDGPLPAELKLYADLRRYHKHPLSGRLVPATDWKLNPPNDTIDVIPVELHNRDMFAQVLYIPPYHNLEQGEYALTLGAYDGLAVNGLAVLDREHNGTPRGDLLWLGTIMLEAPLASRQ